uniref:Uncharacterized protein n=1 Tax=Coptotermes formosanus TaxID=36987 RepID=R4V2H0_COPFO|nr:hypothetical protein [Coptotermes formosanus]
MVQNFSVPQRFKEISVEEFETLIKKWLKISKKPFTKVDDSYPMYEIESEEEGIDTLVRMVLFSRTDKPNLIKNASSLHRLTVHFSSTDQISFDNITNIRQIQSVINEYSSQDFEKWTPYLLRTHSRLTIIPFNISFLLNELVPKFRKQFYFTNYSQTAVNFYPINETDLPAVVVSTRYRNYYLLKNAQSITEVDTFLESILNKTIEPINMTERDESFGDRKFLQDFEDPEFRKEFFFIFGLCVAAVVIGCILVISVNKFIIEPCRKRVTAKKEAQKQNEAKKEQ